MPRKTSAPKSHPILKSDDELTIKDMLHRLDAMDATMTREADYVSQLLRVIAPSALIAQEQFVERIERVEESLERLTEAFRTMTKRLTEVIVLNTKKEE